MKLTSNKVKTQTTVTLCENDIYNGVCKCE
jgi:hypothetical protein